MTLPTPEAAPEKSAPVVLAVALGAADRRDLSNALSSEFRVCALEPAALSNPARLLDAAAAVAVLGPGAGSDDLRALKALRSLPANNALVLVVDGANPDLVEAALADLQPVHALGHPAPAALLRFAVRNALPSSLPGSGARPHHRPAPALLGVSTAIRGVLDQVAQIAPSHIPVLILGETGTGKELVARAIHERSPRQRGPFVAVNCAALPDSLLESELFGHRRGAFTGADTDQRGLFEQAHGGTILLDEIGDTTQALQMKLLRVLETSEIRPLGDTVVRHVDVRLVSATNRDLEAAIEAGVFRQDLYYRLNAATIYVPPLRRRRVDIPFLAQHFAEEFGAAHARRITVGEDFLETLGRRDFPGNVRELRNAVERAIALADPGKPVSAHHLAPPSRLGSQGPACGGGTLRDRVDQLEREAILDALSRSGGNLRRAADALGLTRPGLRYKMRRLELEG